MPSNVLRMLGRLSDLTAVECSPVHLQALWPVKEDVLSSSTATLARCDGGLASGDSMQTGYSAGHSTLTHIAL